MQKNCKNALVFFLLLIMLCQISLPVLAADSDPTADRIISHYYHIDQEKNLLTGVAPGTSAQHLLSVCLPNTCELSRETPSTGTTIRSASHALTVVVTGDLNGDGAVNVADRLMLSAALKGGKLNELAAVAADINYDGEISGADLVQLQAHISGQRSIRSGHPAGTDAEPVIILTPGTSQSWKGPEGTAAYSCDSSVVSVNRFGKITGISFGSAFVYATDANGTILNEIMVSVVEQPLMITFPVSWQAIALGEPHTLTPQFNHPIATSVTWETSDASIVTVTPEGMLIPRALGSAFITAALPNGNSAQVTVNVTPPQGFLSFDRELYKVRPGNYRHPRLILSCADSAADILWTSSDPSIASVSQDGTVYGVAYGDVTITATNKYSGEYATCCVSVCDVKQVAVTFDDGPGGNTKWLLNYLEKKNIPATFFLIGNQISTYPETVIRQAAEGHEIGYHSYTHENQLYLPSERIMDEFETTNELLKSLTGTEFTLWRTPGGHFDQRVLDCVPVPHIHWSADTWDWKNRNANSIANRIVGLSIDGSIILMHDIYGTTVEGAIRGIDALLDLGFEFVTVSELLARDGDPAKNCTNYQDGYNVAS